MSLIGMTRLSLRPGLASGDAMVSASKKSDAETTSAVRKIVAFIPSEVLALYIAGMGVFRPEGSGEKWLIFAICGVLIPLFVLFGAYDARRRGAKTERLDLRVPDFLLLTIFGVVAYIAWVAAMPESAFSSLSPRATAYGAWSAIVLSAIMPRLAMILGVAR